MAKRIRGSDRQPVLQGFEEPEEPAGSGESVSEHEQSTATAGESLDGQTVYVIDAFALIYQVFYAMPNFPGPNGQPVGAIYGFIRDMADLLEHQQPNYMFCAFDAPGDTFRHEMYDQYKATRDPMPDDLRSQIPAICRLLEAMAIPVLSMPGFEADDILATVARQVEERGGSCLLVTNDKDCRQLITDQVQMYNIRKDTVFDAAALMESWGVRPEQVVDFQSLVGDSVDNIPGVPQIGPKTARELLEKHGTLENVLDHAGEVTAKKRRENLMAGREQAMLSRKLVKLDAHVPVELDWQRAHVGGMDSAQLAEICDEYGFGRLKDRLVEMEQPSSPAVWEADYHLVATREELDQLVESLSSQQRISVDTETTSLDPRQATIVGYSFCWQAGEAYYVPVKAPQGQPQLDPGEVREALRPVLEDAGIQKIGQNLKYDMVALRSEGIRLKGVFFDTMVADYLDRPGQASHSLDDLSRRYLNHQMIPISDLIGRGKNQKRLDEIDVERVAEYAAEDADVPIRIVDQLHQRLEGKGLLDLFQEVEMPLVEILAELQFNGICLDVEHLQELSAELGGTIEQLKQQIYEVVGREFNIDSRIQLGRVLFEELELPVIKRTKTGPSTDADVLGQLSRRTDSPLPAMVIQYRQQAKLKSTYLDALPKLVHPQTGRIHSSFKQDVAATGRLSSADPNLQNIPVRTEQGRQIRSAFLPHEGWQLLAADYSQIELRVLAHFSADVSLRQAFEEGLDIHSRVASEVYGVELSEVTPEMRRSAKAINFGVIYGQSSFGLAKALDIDKEDAAAFIESYFSEYPGVARFFNETLDQCCQDGFVSTILGRRRQVEGVRRPEKRDGSRFRNLPERIAINTVIQGSAADLIKQAMVRLYRRMTDQQLQSRMLLQIHDELVFEVPGEECQQMISLVEAEMIAAGDNLDVPLVVDIKIGNDWGSCEPVERE
jgi:DNA polymerase-1